MYEINIDLGSSLGPEITRYTQKTEVFRALTVNPKIARGPSGPYIARARTRTLTTLEIPIKKKAKIFPCVTIPPKFWRTKFFN
eukprot:UN11926